MPLPPAQVLALQPPTEVHHQDQTPSVTDHSPAILLAEGPPLTAAEILESATKVDSLIQSPINAPGQGLATGSLTESAIAKLDLRIRDRTTNETETYQLTDERTSEFLEDVDSETVTEELPAEIPASAIEAIPQNSVEFPSVPLPAEGTTEILIDAVPDSAGSLPTAPIPEDTILPSPTAPETLIETAPEAGETTASPPPITIPIEPASVIEITADTQSYDQASEVVTATGNVVIRFANGVLIADQVNINLRDRLALGEGQVVLRRPNQQVLRGERFEYFFFQDQGRVLDASGSFLRAGPETETASSAELFEPTTPSVAVRRVPQTNVQAGEGFSTQIGNIQLLRLASSPDTTEEEDRSIESPEFGTTGQINRIRFAADYVEFDQDGWRARNVRLTNDPFSPPEFELRADTAQFRQLSPLVSEIVTTNSRLVFDDGLAIPTFRNRFLLDQRDDRTPLFQLNFDGEDRGGLYIERAFPVAQTPRANILITPQYFVQRALFPGLIEEDDDIETGQVVGLDSFGLRTDLLYQVAQRTDFTVAADLTSLDLDKIDDNLEADIRLSQKIGNLNAPHRLDLAYVFRERVFNGSLGFRRIEQSIGLTLVSPQRTLGKTGIRLRYQAALENIEAETDRRDLLPVGTFTDDVNLTRYQVAAELTRPFVVWTGDLAPLTPDAAFRYSPRPIRPNIIIQTRLAGIYGQYSNGDSQPVLTAAAALTAQFGNFARPWFDYTAFNIGFRQGIRGSESPFRFDRFEDLQVLTLGASQQLYGPFRARVQASYSLTEDEGISTDFFLEYSRRAYQIEVRYNPVKLLGAINLRISDFNWSGDAEPFTDPNRVIDDTPFPRFTNFD
ncbi:MAG: DUF3769 domain-containing protein [Cyanobacteria bacterium P01_H01_bin.15]